MDKVNVNKKRQNALHFSLKTVYNICHFCKSWSLQIISIVPICSVGPVKNGLISKSLSLCLLSQKIVPKSYLISSRLKGRLSSTFKEILGLSKNTSSLLKIRYIFSSALEDFWGGHNLRRLYPKQGTYFHPLSSAFGGSPLPPPLRRWPLIVQIAVC